MEELSALLESKDSGKDLIDKLIGLLDRQTDHKISPNVLLGILGLFNVLTIMGYVRENPDTGIKQVTGDTDNGGGTQGQALADTLSGLMKSQGGGQPDLMSLIGNLASKKKINPGLLLSLFNMLNQGGPAGNPNMTQPPSAQPEQKANQQSAQSGTQNNAPSPTAQQKEASSRPNDEISKESQQTDEKKTPDAEQRPEQGLERKRGIGRRS